MWLKVQPGAGLGNWSAKMIEDASDNEN